MEYSKECPFCRDTRFENSKLVNLPTEESILFENENIYVQVDISPLCLGHILIITNKHYLNFFETPNYIKEDVIKLKTNLIQLYKKLYNTDVLFFEHGSAKSGYAGASIDHAHLHCIPYQFDISQDLNKLLGDSVACDILSLNNNFNNEFSYIYLESKENGKQIHKVKQLPSQFLRRLTSEKLGNTDYLWQEKCITKDSVNNLKQTIIDLQGKIFI